eukprot:g13801.t1
MARLTPDRIKRPDLHSDHQQRRHSAPAAAAKQNEELDFCAKMAKGQGTRKTKSTSPTKSCMRRNRLKKEKNVTI